MSWTSIARQGTETKSPIPADGVRVYFHNIHRAGGGKGGFIAIQVGADLARGLGLTGDSHAVRLMIGSGNDAGKVAIAVDTAGPFAATRMALGKKNDKPKAYRIVVNKQSAAGLFASEFPAFERAGLEVIKPENGQPRMTSFLATGSFLAPKD